MDFVVANGVRLAYDVRGADGADLVVLVGGSGMPMDVWDLTGIPEELQRTGHRVLTFAARGVAPSDAPPSPYSIDDLVKDLVGLLERLQVESCQMVGYSLGGFVVELFCRAHPALVRSAVLLASTGPASPVDRAVVDMEDGLIAELGRLPGHAVRFWEFITAVPFDMLREDPEQADLWREILGASEDCWSAPHGELGQTIAANDWSRDPDRMDRLADIAAPVLVLCFENDLLYPPNGGRVAAEQIPNGEFREIAGGAHAGLFTHTDPCRKAILSYLAHH